MARRLASCPNSSVLGCNSYTRSSSARLLAPADFGLVAMASPVLAFVSLFADFGLTQATVQRPNISHSQLSLIFWVNCLLSVALAFLTIAVAPLVAEFYHDKRVGPVVMALGATFIISGCYTQHLALLNRRLAFIKLAVIDLISFAAGALVGLTSAFEGLSYWAIVLNQLTSGCVSLLLAWTLTRWIPSCPRATADARSLLGFGGNITTFNIVNYFARNLDNVLIGRVVGGVELGFYDRAYKLLLLPLSQITGPFGKVATPLLGRLSTEPGPYRRAYMRMLETICMLTYPGVAFALVSSHDLINVVLGPKWDGVAPIFSVLAIGAFFAPISNSTGWLFITQDRTAEMRNWGVLSSLLFVMSFIVGLHWGVLGVASCYIAVGALQGPMVWWAATRRGPVDLRSLLGGLAPYGVALMVTVPLEWSLRHAFATREENLLACAGSTYPLFAACLLATSGGRQALTDVGIQVQQLYRSARDSMR